MLRKVNSCIIVTLIFLASAKSAVVFSDFTLTDRELTVTLSGRLPSESPPEGRSFLLFVNPDQFESPGFVSEPDPTGSSEFRFSGVYDIVTSSDGPERYGDYLLVEFDSEFTPDSEIDGIMSLSWSSPIFAPSAAKSLDIYWGVGSNLAEPAGVVEGIFLGSIRVPEVSSTIFLGLGLCSALGRRRRRVNNGF